MKAVPGFRTGQLSNRRKILAMNSSDVDVKPCAEVAASALKQTWHAQACVGVGATVTSCDRASAVRVDYTVLRAHSF